jgi:hypothetical protein
LGKSIALMSTTPLIVRPVLPTHLLNARANRVMEFEIPWWLACLPYKTCQ